MWGGQIEKLFEKAIEGVFAELHNIRAIPFLKRTEPIAVTVDLSSR